MAHGEYPPFYLSSVVETPRQKVSKHGHKRLRKTMYTVNCRREEPLKGIGASDIDFTCGEK